MQTHITFTGRPEVRMEYTKDAYGSNHMDAEVVLTPQQVFELMYDIIADCDLGEVGMQESLLEIADSIHGAITCANEAYED